MAARINPNLSDEWRAKIKTSMLINRLMAHANGECDMSATQVRAAEILLKKTLADLTENKNTNYVAKISDLSDHELDRIIATGGSGEGKETPTLN